MHVCTMPCTDIVQYEADIILPDDFYGPSNKSQPDQQPTEQQRIDELVSNVC